MASFLQQNLIFQTLKITVFILCFNFTCSAQNLQDSGRSTFWNQVRFGGGVGLSFGDGFFSGALSPSAIYDFTSTFSAGVGLNFIYSKQSDLFESTVLGGSLITLFNPLQEIQLSAEFEQLNVNRDFNQEVLANTDDNYWYPALFLGAGYRTGQVIFGIRYDVLYDEDKSIYADPWLPFVRFFF